MSATQRCRQISGYLDSKSKSLTELDYRPFPRRFTNKNLSAGTKRANFAIAKFGIITKGLEKFIYISLSNTFSCEIIVWKFLLASFSSNKFHLDYNYLCEYVKD